MPVISSMEAHNLSLLVPPGVPLVPSGLPLSTEDLLGYNDSLWAEDQWLASSSPTNLPPFVTSPYTEDYEVTEADCGQNIRHMNFTHYDYPYRTDTWIPFTWREVLKVVAYVVVFLVSVAGNLLVILVVCYNTTMRSSTNQYLVNLAVADLLVTLVCMWVHIVRHLSYPNYVLPALLCKLDSFVQATSLLASVLTLTVISVGRFVAVMFPLHARTSPNHAHRVIVAVWLVSAAFSCPNLFYRELYSTEWANFTSWACEEFWPTVNEYNATLQLCVVTYDAKKVYYMFLAIALYFIPVAVMLVNYSLVVWTLWMAKLPGEQSAPSRNTAVRSKKRVVKMVSVVLLVFVICWTPLQSILLYSNFESHEEHLPEWFSTMEFLAYFLAYSNSALNPIIYCGFNANFRQGLVSLVTCGRSRAFLRDPSTRRWVLGGTLVRHSGATTCSTTQTPATPPLPPTPPTLPHAGAAEEWSSTPPPATPPPGSVSPPPTSSTNAAALIASLRRSAAAVVPSTLPFSAASSAPNPRSAVAGEVRDAAVAMAGIRERTLRSIRKNRCTSNSLKI